MVAAMLLRRLTWRGQGGPWASVLRVAAVLVVLLGIAASAWIARGWDAAVTRQRDERLDHSATSRTTAIGEMLREYESALYAERSLWLASAFVSHKDFETFASSLDLSRRYPGLQGIGWRAFVPHEQADEFVADARRHGPADFTIRPAGKLPGNPILTERTIPASLLLGTGIAISVLLGTLLWLLAQVSTLYQRVGRMARTDPLTGVHNPRHGDRRMAPHRAAGGHLLHRRRRVGPRRDRRRADRTRRPGPLCRQGRRPQPLLRQPLPVGRPASYP